MRATRVAAVLTLAFLACTGSGYAALGAPSLTGPADASTSQAAPVFTWQAVAGADHYAFQLGGQTGFSPAQATVDTRNNRVALTSALQSGDYTWRVSAVTAGGNQGPWSEVRHFTVDWADTAQPQTPDDLGSITYPEPLLIDWTPVAGAQQYKLTVATSSDLSAGSTVGDTPVTTAASAYVLPDRIPDGTYYWSVTPVDAQNHDGTPSPVYSFSYSWPTDTTLSLNDLDPSPEVFDPQFSWTAIPGATYYEVDVSTDPSFPSGSNVCCTGKTAATSLTPTTLLPAAQSYYWEVTPFFDATAHQSGTPTVYTDVNGDPQTFTITYDGGLNAVSNLSMRDSADAPIAWPGDAVGVPTDTPIVSWDPVPGAASYEVQVSPYANNICDWSIKKWDVHTVTTAWTPLGSAHALADPWPGHTLATDTNGLVNGNPYCVRVKAERNVDTANQLVTGSWNDVGDDVHPSFTFTGPPAGGACSGCSAGYLGSGDYTLPQSAAAPGTPLFTWQPIAGYGSYYVVVATDAQFQHVIDYAWTQVPAYAPRTGTGVANYPDGTYYWAVLPATDVSGNGTGVVARPDVAPTETFQKQSAAPTLTAPADSSTVTTWPVFQWTPVDGAYDYHLQVASDQQFNNLVTGGNVKVDETSYTPTSTFPSGQTLYWRVQAEAKNGGIPTTIGLAWSAPSRFTKTLPVATFNGVSNPQTSDGIPIWQWDPVPGAVSYDLVFTCPAGMFCTNQTRLGSTAYAAPHFTGTKPFTWTVKANFPTVSGGSPSSPVQGGASAVQSFQRLISAPANPVTAVANLHNFSFGWDPKSGAKQYVVEVSLTQSQQASGAFTSPFEVITTDAAGAAPTLMNSPDKWANGGNLYWHVAAKDADGNLGSYTPIQTLTLPAKLVETSSRSSVFSKSTTSVTITVKSANGGSVISNASVKVSGAGVATKTQKTGAHGTTTFKLHPTKKGKITVTASKTGAQTATMTITVL